MYVLNSLLCDYNLCSLTIECVCPPPRLLITSGVIWRDIDPIQLVKQVV